MDIEISGMGRKEYFYLSAITLFLLMLVGAWAYSGSGCSDYVAVSAPNDISSYSSYSDLRSDMLDNGRISGAEDWHQIKQDAGLIRDDIDMDGEFEVLKEDCGSDPIPAW